MTERIPRALRYLLVACSISLTVFLATMTIGALVILSHGDSLDGYCYGVMDSRGQMHPSVEAPVGTALGLVTKVPLERVVYIHDPVYTVADTQCICEQGLEDLPKEECLE